MLLNKKKYKIVSKVIDSWKTDNVITEDLSVKLKESIELSKFDWKRLAKYSFWISAISIAISVFSIILDDSIIALIQEIFKTPHIVKAIFLAVASALLYYWGFNRRKYKPLKKFSNEFLLFIGAIVTGASIVFLGLAVDTGSGHFSLLILLASFVYLGIGGFFPSTPMWILGIISLGSWFGTETGYVSGWGAYFLGMNYPLRFILLGTAIIAISLLVKKTQFSHLANSTKVMGLLNLFIALWLMSIWGNYGDMATWHVASHIERFIWSFLFGAAAIASIIWGLKEDDGALRGFGITFLFINLYTKYFEYFWTVSHKAVFFALLGISCWLVGRYSEKVYNALRGKILEVPD